MGLFFISFFLVFISSYLLTSVLSPKKAPVGFNYLFLIAFAQIILTFEILSLFNSIKQFWVLGFNLIFLMASIYIWNKKSRPLWEVDLKSFINRVKNSFKLDTSLAFLFGGFCIFLTATIILCLFMPITNMDALAYHVVRSLFWVINGNLNHFETSDIRNLCLPINSEILYSWVLLFFKQDVFLGFFAFVGYLLSIFSVYNILGLIGFCTRKKLWVIFILSSFASVIVQAAGTETDIIVAGLLTSSVFLFWYSLKNKEKTPLFMSALACALAAGTKTTALMAIPGVALLFIALSISFMKKEFYKPLLTFIGAGLITFLIFSSFNYILNYIHFKNIFSSESLMQVTKNYYGIKAIPANFIKYIFLFFDFTGFRWSQYIGRDIMQIRDALLNNLHLGQIKDGLYSLKILPNGSLVEPLMGAGILGFLVFLPCLAWSSIKPLFKRKSKKTWILFGFASLFVINLLVMSYLIAFMVFSIRFIMCFMVLSSPILAYSYLKMKNPLKHLIVLFSLFYLIGVSTHLWARPLNKMIPVLIKNPSISALRERAKCSGFDEIPRYSDSVCLLKAKIESHYTTDNKFLVFLSDSDSIFMIKELYFKGYNIDFATLEDAEKINFDNYKSSYFPYAGQSSTYIKDYETRKDEIPLINGKPVIIKKRPVMCIYTPNKNLPATKDGKPRYPYMVSCGMGRNFLEQKNLIPFAAAGLADQDAEKPTFFIIYRNAKLPLYLKKNHS